LRKSDISVLDIQKVAPILNIRAAFFIIMAWRMRSIPTFRPHAGLGRGEGPDQDAATSARGGTIAVSTSRPIRRPMLLSPLWLQGIVLTFVVGFAILAYLAIRIYRDHAPIPGRIASEAGQTV